MIPACLSHIRHVDLCLRLFVLAGGGWGGTGHIHAVHLLSQDRWRAPLPSWGCVCIRMCACVRLGVHVCALFMLFMYVRV